MIRLAMVSLLAACGGQKVVTSTTPAPSAFISSWSEAAVPLWTAWQSAEWEAHLHVRDNDSSFAEKAGEARVAWELEVGKPDWLTQARDVLAEANERARSKIERKPEDAPPPTDAEMAAVETIRLIARNNNESAREIRTRQQRDFGLQLRTRDRSLPRLDGAPIPPEELEGRFRAAQSVDERARLWSGVLSSAKELKPGFASLRDTYNQSAQKAGSDNLHAAMAARAGMKPDELAHALYEIEVELRPLYRQLHTWLRYELTARYGVAEVPEHLPAHWLNDPLAMTWNGIINIPGTDPSAALMEDGVQKMLADADGFFSSLGIGSLSGDTWARSSLYPPEPGARFQKTPGASTWDIDLGSDIRILMSATPIEPWMHAAHREFALAHILQDRAAAKVPAPLHVLDPGVVQQALATWMDLAASRPARLAAIGLIDADKLPDDRLRLLDDALTWVPFIVASAGTAATFEREFYQDKLPADRVTGRWWELAREHQGVTPPETRTERWADPLYLAQLTDMPGRYYEFALSAVVAFQLHEAACKTANIDVRTADMTGNEAAGKLFREMALAADVKDWRKTVEELTGAPPGAAAMVRYFEPLMTWLQEENDQREQTLPKL